MSKGLQFNISAKKEFDLSLIDDITPDNSYPIWAKKDCLGRVYYGVAHFYGADKEIKEDTDLSWMEWHGNEVFLSDEDKSQLFKRAVGVIKGWKNQLTECYPKERFVVIAYYNDGSDVVEGCDSVSSFTLRFWKIRDGQGPDENMDFDQPAIKWVN